MRRRGERALDDLNYRYIYIRYIKTRCLCYWAPGIITQYISNANLHAEQHVVS